MKTVKALPAMFREMLLDETNLDDTKFMGVEVEFTAKIEDLETIADRKMRARIVGVMTDNHGDLVKILFDFEPWDYYNRQYEAHNYYDKMGVPQLTAREAGQYRSTEWCYFELTDSPATFFKLIGATSESPRYTVVYRDVEVGVMRTSRLETTDLNETLFHIHHDIVMVFAGWPDRVK